MWPGTTRNTRRTPHRSSRAQGCAALGAHPPPRAARFEAKRVLICGWRAKWTEEPGLLRARINGLTSRLGPGSSICFMNQARDAMQRTIVMEWNGTCIF